MEEQIVKEGETAKKPSDPTRDKYTFIGWYADEECTEEFDFENTTIDESTAVYAKWEEGYKVSFVTGEGTEVKSQIVKEGETAKNLDESPTRDGYTFGGWYTDEDCTNEFDVENTTIDKPTTLYAKWNKESEDNPTE